MNKAYNNLIKKYCENDDLYDQIINLILVSGGARSSFLFETTNLEGDKKRIQKVFDAVDELNLSLTKPLKYTVDDNDFPRYFIYLTDSWVDKTIKKKPYVVNKDFWIAKFLDFQCIGHDYSNQYKDRIVISYNVKEPHIGIITEVCEIDRVVEIDLRQTADTNNKKFNEILKPLGFETELNIYIDYSIPTRYNKLKEKDRKFVQDNVEEYQSDFENYYISDDAVYKSSQTYNKLGKILNVSDSDLEKLTKLYYEAIIQYKYND